MQIIEVQNVSSHPPPLSAGQLGGDLQDRFFRCGESDAYGVLKSEVRQIQILGCRLIQNGPPREPSGEIFHLSHPGPKEPSFGDARCQRRSCGERLHRREDSRRPFDRRHRTAQCAAASIDANAALCSQSGSLHRAAMLLFV